VPSAMLAVLWPACGGNVVVDSSSHATGSGGAGGIGVCSPGPACTADGSVCANDADCCSCVCGCGICRSLSPGTPCTTSSDCPSGRTCLAGGLGCGTPCTDDAVCTPPGRCDEILGICVYCPMPMGG
jgi:hypothetical protein